MFACMMISIIDDDLNEWHKVYIVFSIISPSLLYYISTVFHSVDCFIAMETEQSFESDKNTRAENEHDTL